MARKKAAAKKAPKPVKAPKPKKITKARRRELEKEFQGWACDFMEHRRWRKFRNNPLFAMTVGGRGVSSNEKGAPDNHFVYYFGTYQKPSPLCLLLWIEFKAEGEEPDPHQSRWHRDERVRGGLVWVAGSLDPETNRRKFEEDYYALFGWLHGPKGYGQTELFAAAGLPQEWIPA